MMCGVVKAVCSFLLRVIYWIPAVAAMATFGWSYYAYVFGFCGKYVKEQALRFVFTMMYHLLLFFSLWPYALTTFTSPAPVPESFHFSPEELRDLESCAKSPTRKKAVLEAMAGKRGVLTRSARGFVKYCDRCQCIKPDRCHHCSHCGRCITKMDHHCPWFNNCVSFSTYKFFLLTLFYIILLGAYASASTSLYFWHSNPRRHLLKHSIHISFLVLVGATVVFVMGGFLCMHLVFVARNRSTIENIQRPKFRENGDSFNLGIRRNFMEVFGTNAAMWTLPVHTSLGDGVRFPTRLHPEPDAPTSGAPHESATTAPASSSGNAISSLTGRAPSDNEENLPTGEAATKGSVSAGEATIGSPGRKLAACSA